jgi:7-cyano-7-deazaguanine synthase
MKALLLLSGGIDSTTALAFYSQKGYELTCLTFNYGQKNQFEIQSSKLFAQLYKVKEHIFVDIDNQIFNSSSSLNSEKEVEKFEYYTPVKDFIPSTYLPSRNIIFLSFATGIAESRQINNIIFSPNKEDSFDYPDCTLDFVEAFSSALNKGTHIGKNSKINILTPFIDKTKSEIIELGLTLNVDYSKTQTCYIPDEKGNPCLKCDACLLRLQSFKKLNMPKFIQP